MPSPLDGSGRCVSIGDLAPAKSTTTCTPLPGESRTTTSVGERRPDAGSGRSAARPRRRVVADRSAAVLEGRDPQDGVRLVQVRKDRIPGFDLTFWAPKSVSVLFGLGDPGVVREVREAHDCVGRRRARVARTRGVCVSAWDQRCRAVDGRVRRRGVRAPHESSCGPPAPYPRPRRQPHQVRRSAQCARCPPLFRQAQTAGYLYKAQLRAELTPRLGVEWGAVRNGARDRRHPPACAEWFSTRRARSKKSWHAAVSPPRGRRGSRPSIPDKPKLGPVDLITLRARWSEQAATFGLTSDMLAESSTGPNRARCESRMSLGSSASSSDPMA